MIDENTDLTWNSSYAINKPLMSYGADEETGEVEVETVTDILDTVEVEEGVGSTSQRPQRTRLHLERLQDCEVVGDD